MATYSKLQVTTVTPDFRRAVEVKSAVLKKPSGKQLVLRTLWAGVNASDVNWSAGRYMPIQAGMKPPFNCGFESVCEVIEVGANIGDRFQPGQIVLSAAVGGFSEYQVVSAALCIRLPQKSPKYLAVPVNGVTALASLEICAQPKEGEVALVTAAAGGTGQFAVQLLKKKYKCHVIGTCSGGEKVDFLKSLGCDRVVDYKTENLSKVLRSEYKKGVDVIFESVGGSMFESALKNIAVKGRMVVIGAIEGYTGKNKRTEMKEKPPNWLNMICVAKGVRIQGFLLTHLTPRENANYVKEMMTLVQSDAIHSAVDSKPFSGVEGCAGAVEHLHSGKSIGKIAVSFNGATVSKL